MCKMFFGTLVLGFAFGGVTRADDQADAIAILDAGIKARGGEAALGKFVGIYCKAKGTWYRPKKPLSVEWFIQGIDKMRKVSFDENDKVAWVDVLNGKEGWTKQGDQGAKNLDANELRVHRDDIFLTWATMLVRLKAKEFRLSPLNETSVSGRTAVGILVSHWHDPLRLYFDKESHLFVKYERTFINDIGEDFSTHEVMFSDYQTVQGTKQPFKIETLWEGKKAFDLVVSELKFYEKPLDEKLFAKP